MCNIRVFLEQNVLSGFCQQRQPDINLAEGIKPGKHFKPLFFFFVFFFLEYWEFGGHGVYLTNSSLTFHVLPDCYFFYSTSHGAEWISSQYLISAVELQLRLLAGLVFTDCGGENGILLWWLCSMLWFPLCMSVRMQPFVSDNGWSDNNSGRAGGDMSQTSCMGSTATKLCAVTWLVEALGPHNLYCCYQEEQLYCLRKSTG